MTLGKTICELRRSKNITQEDLASELGVTAAAVSKWENGYTLPDVLMLCALADYFQVTTDDLLGRKAKPLCAAIAANAPDRLGKIQTLVEQYGFQVKHKIYGNYEDALAIIDADPAVTHLFISFDKPMESHPRGSSCAEIIESQADSEAEVLGGFELYLKNRTVFGNLITKNKG